MKAWFKEQGQGSGFRVLTSAFEVLTVRGSGLGTHESKGKARIMARGGSAVRRAVTAVLFDTGRRVHRSSRAVLALLWTALLVGSPGVVMAMQPPTGAAQEGFVPLDTLPPQEQLPAAPLLITAYAFVWVLLMVYLWSIARRLMKVEGEIQTLQRRSGGSSAR